MKLKSEIVLALLILMSCSEQKSMEQQTAIQLEGTWQLISGTVIEKGDTTLTDYTKDKNMIKIINTTHFAFLNHDLNKGKDSTNVVFAAGGGKYELKDDQYIEHLEYCNAREWEGNTFAFTIKIKNDTLAQSGIEKIEGIGVNRLNIEKYARVK